MNRRVLAVALLSLCSFVSIASADLLVSDNFGNQVLRYDQQTGAFLGVLVSSDNNTNGGLSGAVGMRLDGNGDLLVASQNTNSILKYNVGTGAFLGEFASASTGANFAQPADIRFGSSGDLYVANFGGNSIDRVSSTGTWLGAFTSGGPGLAGVSSFAFAPNGDLYAGSFGSGDIFVYDGVTGAYQSTFATGLFGASGLMFDGDGDLWVASLLSHEISEFNTLGQQITNFSTGADTFPSHLLINPNDASELLVALTGGGGVYRFSNSGTALGPFAFGGGLQVPGQSLLVTVPEPTTAVGLFLVTSLLGLTRRRR